MFAHKLKASRAVLGQVAEKKRRFASKIPFQQEVRNKRQHVSLGLPKVDTAKPERPESPGAHAAGNNNRNKNGSSGDENSRAVQSVYCAESRLEDRKQRAAGKRIRFEDGTKDWNGLRVDRHYFDELVYQFFVLGKQFSSVDVLRLTGIDSTIVEGVNKLLQDLCKRIEGFSTSEDVGVPVLIRGGGHGMKVSCFHLPYLQSLQRVVAEAERIVSLGISLNGDDSDGKDEPMSNNNDAAAQLQQPIPT
ncbi:Uncharacterized protein SCF082_LOCUS16610 [Durusdinium trenchii]|uniref:Smr domain-containing protein n=1 Tax=Durusdinium trenchii TaxID=1381693 RepID=A0ABP0KDF7_9DINO